MNGPMLLRISCRPDVCCPLYVDDDDDDDFCGCNCLKFAQSLQRLHVRNIRRIRRYRPNRSPHRWQRSVVGCTVPAAIAVRTNRVRTPVIIIIIKCLLRCNFYFVLQSALPLCCLVRAKKQDALLSATTSQYNARFFEYFHR